MRIAVQVSGLLLVEVPDAKKLTDDVIKKAEALALRECEKVNFDQIQAEAGWEE